MRIRLLIPILGAALVLGAVPVRAATDPEPDQVTYDSDDREDGRLVRNGLRISEQPYGRKRVVFSVPAPELDASERVLVRAELGLSVCSDDDIQGDNNDRNEPCKGISAYGYQPAVNVKAILGESRRDRSGPNLSGWERFTCTHAEHHCAKAIAVQGSAAELPTEPSNLRINLVVAVDADGRNPDRDDVVDIEQGNGRLDVVRLGANRATENPPVRSTERERVDGLPIDTTDGSGGKERIVYRERVDGLRAGDVLDVTALLRTNADRDYAFNPLVRAELVLVRNKRATDVDTGAGEEHITVLNGFNCTAKGADRCASRKAGAVRIGADAAGTMYVNLVASGRRTNPQAGGTVNVKDGGRLDVTHWTKPR